MQCWPQLKLGNGKAGNDYYITICLLFKFNFLVVEDPVIPSPKQLKGKQVHSRYYFYSELYKPFLFFT